MANLSPPAAAGNTHLRVMRAQLTLFASATVAPTPTEDAAREGVLLAACGGPAAGAAHELGAAFRVRLNAEIGGWS